jgi:hypothetical protein
VHLLCNLLSTHFLQQVHWLALAPVLLKPMHLVNIHLQDRATQWQQQQHSRSSSETSNYVWSSDKRALISSAAADSMQLLNL